MRLAVSITDVTNIVFLLGYLTQMGLEAPREDDLHIVYVGHCNKVGGSDLGTVINASNGKPWPKI